MGYKARPTVKQIATLVVIGVIPVVNFIIGVLMMMSQKLYVEILRRVIRNARKVGD